ncbi:MAG: hypothetical protein KC944_17765 [Candidatus Omnitrophica bacterium]|nr:hypothetical protein [Candidatus Omnitrophota bacterium]
MINKNFLVTASSWPWMRVMTQSNLHPKKIDPLVFAIFGVAILAILFVIYISIKAESPNSHHLQHRSSILVAEHFFDAYDSYPRDLEVLRGNLSDDELRVGLYEVALTTESATQKVGALTDLSAYGFLESLEREQLAKLIRNETRTEVLLELKYLPEYESFVGREEQQ